MLSSSSSISLIELFIDVSKLCLSLVNFFCYRFIIASRIFVVNFIAVKLWRRSFAVAEACKLQQNTILPFIWIKLVSAQLRSTLSNYYCAIEISDFDRLLNEVEAKIRSFSDSLVSEAVMSELAAKSDEQSSTKS